MSRDNYHHGNLQEALVAAAQSLVEQSGHEAISLRGVAREAGVSQAAPYHHFPNKEALLASVCHIGYSQLIEVLDDATDGITDPVAHLEAMGRGYIRFGLERPHLYDLMFSNTCPADRHPDLQGHGLQAFTRLVDAVMRGQELGVFRQSETVPLAIAVWSALHGLVGLVKNHLSKGKKMGGVSVSEDLLIEEVLSFVHASLRVPDSA